MNRNARLLAAALAGLVGITGCHCCHKKRDCCGPQPCAAAPLPPVPANAPIVVPGSPAPVPPPPVGVGPAPVAPPLPVNAGYPPIGGSLQPAQVAGPVSAEAQLPPRDPVALQTPQGLTPPGASAARVGPASAATEPAAPGGPSVDVPGFALAKSRVATGQKPFRDGILWLQAQGYRTVLYLRPPGENDALLRGQLEKAGMRYLSLEVSAATLNREVVEAFNRQVNDQGNLPLYVFDADGTLTGGMWLLYFRYFEGISEEKARLEAARLGFLPELNPDHKAMADAVARYLQAPNP